MTIACTERGARFRPAERTQRELNRRLKLDLLITAGNAVTVVSDGPRSGSHTLLNLHFVIPALPFVIVVISGRPARLAYDDEWARTRVTRSRRAACVSLCIRDEGRITFGDIIPYLYAHVIIFRQ